MKCFSACFSRPATGVAEVPQDLDGDPVHRGPIDAPSSIAGGLGAETAKQMEGREEDLPAKIEPKQNPSDSRSDRGSVTVSARDMISARNVTIEVPSTSDRSASPVAALQKQPSTAGSDKPGSDSMRSLNSTEISESYDTHSGIGHESGRHFARSASMTCRTGQTDAVQAACDYIFGVNAFVHALQAERGCSTIFVASQGKQLRDLRLRLVLGMNQAWENLQELGEKLGQDINEIMNFDDLLCLRNEVSHCTIDTLECHTKYCKLVESVLITTKDASDPLVRTEVGSHLGSYLVIVHVKELVGQLRSLVGGILASSDLKLSNACHIRLIVIITAIRTYKKSFNLVAPAKWAKEFGKINAEVPSKVLELQEKIMESRTAGELYMVTMSANGWFQMMSKRMDRFATLQLTIAKRVEEKAQLYCKNKDIVMNAAVPCYSVGTAVQEAFQLEVEGILQKEWMIPMHELEMTEEVGKGVTGSVYRATWAGADVVVKVFNEEAIKGGDDSLMKDFGREISALCKMRHPNIITFMGAAIAPPKFCMVLEFAAGGTLSQVLRKAPETINFFSMATQLARGVNYIHEQAGLIHRDLKPLNLLLTGAGQLKVADFGLTLAGAAQDAMEHTNQVGTLRWMAPEVMTNKPYSFPCDIYSVGIILWELLTKDLPWRVLHVEGRLPPIALFKAIQTNLRPTFPHGTPRPVMNLISQCWHPDPSKRPTSAEVLQQIENISANVTAEEAAFCNEVHSGKRREGGRRGVGLAVMSFVEGGISIPPSAPVLPAQP